EAVVPSFRGVRDRVSLHLPGGHMSPATIFLLQLVLGYVAWLLCFGAYIWPRLKSMDRVEAQRAIATLHSFRFFGLVFILPGMIGQNLPTGFARFSAYGNLATGILAMLALLAVRKRALFQSLSFSTVSWASSTWSSITTTASGWAFPSWPASWVRPTRSRSFMFLCS